MSAPIEKNAHQNQTLNYTSLRAVRHLIAGVTVLRDVDCANAKTLSLLRLVADQVALSVHLLESRTERQGVNRD